MRSGVPLDCFQLGTIDYLVFSNSVLVSVWGSGCSHSVKGVDSSVSHWRVSSATGWACEVALGSRYGKGDMLSVDTYLCKFRQAPFLVELNRADTFSASRQQCVCVTTNCRLAVSFLFKNVHICIHVQNIL